MDNIVNILKWMFKFGIEWIGNIGLYGFWLIDLF